MYEVKVQQKLFLAQCQGFILLGATVSSSIIPILQDNTSLRRSSREKQKQISSAGSSSYIVVKGSIGSQQEEREQLDDGISKERRAAITINGSQRKKEIEVFSFSFFLSWGVFGVQGSESRK